MWLSRCVAVSGRSVTSSSDGPSVLLSSRPRTSHTLLCCFNEMTKSSENCWDCNELDCDWDKTRLRWFERIDDADCVRCCMTVEVEEPDRRTNSGSRWTRQTDSEEEEKHNKNQLTVVYRGQPWWAGNKTLRNINPMYHLHCPQITHKHSQPSLPVYLSYFQHLMLSRSRRKQLKEIGRTRGRKPTLPLYSINSGWDEAFG